MSSIPAWMIPVLFIAIIWSLFWKGIALWHAAKKGDRLWFVVLLLVNSLGALDAFYIFYVAKIKTKKLLK